MKLWLGLVFGSLVQSSVLPTDQIIRLARPLQIDEVNAVLAGSRAAVDGKTFLLSYGGRVDGIKVLMRGDGRPRTTRSEGIRSGGLMSAGVWSEWSDYFTDIVEYSGRRAQRCDGSTLPDEFVVTYEHTRSTDKWSAVAGTEAQSSHGFRVGIPAGNPVFDVLSGAVASVSAGQTKIIDGRTARAFTAPFSPLPTMYGVKDDNGPVHQTLWIDVDGLLPVQWDVTQAATVTYSLVFVYVPLDLLPPAGVEASNCVP